MDTRSKIIDWPAARRRLLEDSTSGSPWKVVTGHFDPLLADHARRFSELADQRCRIMVVITEPEKPMFAARDRARLVAALSAVDAVTLAPEIGTEEVLSQLPAESVTREEAADTNRAREFVALVRRSAEPKVI